MFLHFEKGENMKGYIYIEAYQSGNIYGYSTPKSNANWEFHIFTPKHVQDMHYRPELIELIKKSLNANNVQLQTRHDIPRSYELRYWQQGDPTNRLTTWRESLNVWRDILHVDLDEDKYYWRSQPNITINL